MLYHGLKVKILGKKRIHVTLISNCDVKLKWVPSWVLNWAAKSTTMNMFKNIKKEISKFEGSIYQKK